MTRGSVSSGTRIQKHVGAGSDHSCLCSKGRTPAPWETPYSGQCWGRGVDTGRWRQLRLRCKDGTYSLGTLVCGKEVPKGSRSADDKATLRWPGSGLRGQAGLLGCPVQLARPGAPDWRRGGGSRERTAPGAGLGVRHFRMHHRGEGRGSAGLWEKQSWPSVI